MFTKKENNMILCYFYIIRAGDNFCEVQSKNTKHCWIIWKSLDPYNASAPIIIYHKHHINDMYYHKHGKANTVLNAIMKISNHDNYVLNQK